MANSAPLATLTAWFRGQFDVLSNPLIAVYVDATYSYDPAALATLADLGASVIVRSAQLTNVVLLPLAQAVALDADDAQFPAVPSGAPDAAAVAIVSFTGTDSTSPVIAWIDTDPDGNAVTRTFSGDATAFQFDALGIVVL